MSGCLPVTSDGGKIGRDAFALGSILWRSEGLAMPGRRFSELQDEFFETSKRLRLAQKPEEKLELLNELQRIVAESKRALAETDLKKSK